MKNKITPEEFIGKAEYDNFSGFTRCKEGIAITDLIEWRSIRSICSLPYLEAYALRKELGQFIADAINEKIERSKLKST